MVEKVAGNSRSHSSIGCLQRTSVPEAARTALKGRSIFRSSILGALKRRGRSVVAQWADYAASSESHHFGSGGLHRPNHRSRSAPVRWWCARSVDTARLSM
jgi:hypothetical protein